jgi:hypothetical protein
VLDDAINEERATEQLRQTLARTQRQLAEAKQRNADLAAATYSGAWDAVMSMKPILPVVPPSVSQSQCG